MPVDDSLNLSNGIIAEVGYKSNLIKTNLYPIFFSITLGPGFILYLLHLLQADKADTQADSSIVRGR